MSETRAGRTARATGRGWAIAACLPAGVGVPLMLTYVYGVVVLSLCRSRWGCGGGRSQPGDLGVVELENLTKRESCAAVCPLACARHWATWALILLHVSVAVTSPEPGAPRGPLSVLARAVPRTPLSLWGGRRCPKQSGTSLFAPPAKSLVGCSAPCSDGEQAL